MKEYNNYYAKEDIGLAYLRIDSEVLHQIDKTKKDYSSGTLKTRKDVISRYCHSFSNDTVAVSGKCFVKVETLYDEWDKIWLYWWDMFIDNELKKSGLEYFPWHDNGASYLLFATDENQVPLMCTPQFKGFRKTTKHIKL